MNHLVDAGAGVVHLLLVAERSRVHFAYYLDDLLHNLDAVNLHEHQLHAESQVDDAGDLLRGHLG